MCCNRFHGEEVEEPSQGRACASVCAFFALSVAYTKQVSWAPVHVGVYVVQVFLTSAYISATQSLQDVHMRSYMRSLFIRVGGRGWKGSTSLCRALVTWRGGLFLTEGEVAVLSCVCSIFDAGGSVRGCMCVYTHTHTHYTCVARCEPQEAAFR